jgi:hypothetical protein
MVIWSKVRMTFERVWAIEQQVLVLPQGGVEALAKMTIATQAKYVVATIYYRVLKEEDNKAKKKAVTDLLIAKL